MRIHYPLSCAALLVALVLPPAQVSAQSRADLLSGKYVPNVHPFHVDQRGGGVPANDECTAPEVLAVTPDCSSPTPGDNTLATETELGPTCDDQNDSLYIDVYYTFNSGTNTSVDIDLVPSAEMTDWVLVVLDVCGGTELLCIIQPDGPQTVAVSAGTDYIVRVYSNTQYGLSGPFTICVTGTPPPPPAPANDECADAIVITAGTDCVPTDGTTESATESQPADSCNNFIGNANDDVWYSFVATTPDMTISVQGGTDFDAVVELFEGDCDSHTEIGCADATIGGELEEILQSGLTVGNSYLVRLFNYGGTDPADPTFTICAVEGLGGIGMGEHLAGDLFDVFPNPTSGDVSIAWSGTNGDVLIEVLDMTGRLVRSEARTMSHGRTIVLPLGERLGQGTYTVRLTGDNLRDVRRVLVN